MKDAILGFPAALFADVSQRLGDADPFSRLARRLSLWFRPWLEFTRYGLPLAADGSAVALAVRRLVESLPGDGAKRFERLIAIWAGEVSVEASKESVREILSLLFDSPRYDVDELDAILVLEICGALADDIDSLDVETIEAIFDTMKSIHAHLDDGRPPTAIFRTWLGTWSERGERLRLAYDPARTFESSMYSDCNGEALEPLLTTTLNDIGQAGHSIFATGPLPMRGVLFGREGPLFDALSNQAPEAAELYLLLSVDGDFGDTIGPIGKHWYWTGEGVPDAVTFPDAIDRARERGDHALCDILIGCWTLFCTLFHKAPLPNLVGLAQRINALPTDYRSAVLALLKREATAIDQIGRDMDALLSWLPLVNIAPPENFEAFMRDLFSPPLWNNLAEKERRRLIKCEEMFVTLRRLAVPARQREQFGHMIVDWSAVSELVLRRTGDSLKRSVELDPHKPLGDLIFCSSKDKPRMHMALTGLQMLRALNDLNKKGGKHLGGDEISWEDVVYVHAGLCWALRALLDVARNPPEPSKLVH